MNFQYLNFDHVEASRSRPPHMLPQSHPDIENFSTKHQQRRQSSRVNHGSISINRSLSTQPTSVPQRLSDSSNTDSTSEPYGPDRLFANPPLQSIGYHVVRPSHSSVVRFDETQLAIFAADNAARMASIKDELTLAAGKVTPGVDDTPYIQYALQALVGAQCGSLPLHASSSSDAYSDQYQPSQRLEGGEMGCGPMNYPQVAQPARPDAAHTYDPPPQVDRAMVEPVAPNQPPVQFRPVPSAQPPRISSASFDTNLRTSGRWVPVTKDMRESMDPRGRTYQPLTFKPRILRPFSMMILIILCMLMTAALISSTMYSNKHDGLTPYSGSIYSGQYFLFRILPQLLAAMIFLFAQSIDTTSLRVLPFTAMASEDARERYMALFQNLYPTSFVRPQLVGPWQFQMFDVATWLAIFTVPLQSSAFTCIFVHEKWIWAPVQGLVWTLVALYFILLLSTAVLMAYWFRQWTGLAWDVRSVGDLLPLLNRSNGMTSFGRSDLAQDSGDFKAQLRERWFDRLGYWRTEDMLTGGIWYAIGASPSDQDPKMAHNVMGRKASNDQSIDSRELATASTLNRARGNYLPWCLRDGPVLVSVAITALLLVVLLIVSFIPQTQLDSGFFPGLTAKPRQGAFSPANFVYSFVPSLLGMILFLRFQIIDQQLRILQPWGELYNVKGSVARKSLMADYAACLPLQSTWRAARNGHWRVAVVSFLAALFVFIPVLAGGLFMALTSVDDKVRMFPSMPVFGVLLACLFLYVGGLSLMVPRRRRFLLPRPVTSMADIISFCSAEELTQDSAFRSVRGREDLEGRLGIEGADAREESTWFLGVVPGRDEQRLSVRRMNRFTEKRTRTTKLVVQ